MSEKWSIEQVFQSEKSANPFKRDPELMLLWECRDGKEAFLVWRGYDYNILKEVVRKLKATSGASVSYCVEFPSRKGHRDAVPSARRKFDGGAKCLPNQKQRMLITTIEGRWGATLDEKRYMETNGRVKAFFMRSDKTRAIVFEFDTWEEVQKMAYVPRR